MILSPATLGLLGGGQLGRYFIMAAHELGYQVMVLDPNRDSPAGRIADEHLAAAYDDPNALDYMAKNCAAVTTEFESVPASTLAHLARSVPVHPCAKAVAICQNRSAEKNFLKLYGFAHAPYVDISDEKDIENADEHLFPGIVKVASFGYDGKGQTRVADRATALTAFRRLKGEACVLEQQMELDCEVSVVLSRDEAGQVRCFPMTENHHRHGILDHSIVAAQGSTNDLAAKATEISESVATRLAYVGTMCIEFFVVKGQLLVNEIAPRPHNSGHFTLDACLTNQFEQQVRALCGLPLGDTSAHSVAVMANLLGDNWYADGSHQTVEPDWEKLLSVPNLKLHLYGKNGARPGRKMGHFTVIGENREAVRKMAMAARAAIGIKDE